MTDGKITAFGNFAHRPKRGKNWSVIGQNSGNQLCCLKSHADGFAQASRAIINQNGNIEEPMSSVTLQLELPEDWDQFSLPPALNDRLQSLLDQQEQGNPLTESERQEAQALCDLVDMLAILKIRAERAAGPRDQ